MSILSKLFGSSTTHTAVAVILEKELPYGDPDTHARMLADILGKAGMQAARPVHTILSPGIRERSRLITTKISEHYLKETLGADYDENKVVVAPFEYPEGSTSGVIVAHP